MKTDGITAVDILARNTKLCEYLFIVLPDKSETKELINFQAQLSTHYEDGLELLPVRHILLASLLAKESIEETLSRWIMNVCRMHHSFEINFDKECAHQQAVLSLEVINSPELQLFYADLHRLDDFILASDCQPLRVLPSPQLPIAITRNYRVGKTDEPFFNGKMRVREIAMLKRRDPYESFERRNIFALSSQ